MSKLTIMNKVSRSVHKVGFVFKKHSPEILLAAGIVGGVGAAVMACKATLKVNEVLDEAKENIDKIHVATEQGETEAGKEYTQEDSNKDLGIVYLQTGIKLTKLYGPAIILGGLSIASVLTSNKILKTRNLALAAAYTAVDKGFKEYRGRVVERFGEAIDKELRYDIKAKDVEVVEVDEQGNEKSVKATIKSSGYDGYSEYARYFEQYTRDSKGNTVLNSCWQQNNEYNMIFLKAQERYANELLQARGMLFLNEVYRMLGIPESQAGQIVGWIYDDSIEHEGNNFVDFGLHKDPLGYSDFVYGNDNGILLDFNVDGNIWDKM